MVDCYMGFVKWLNLNYNEFKYRGEIFIVFCIFFVGFLNLLKDELISMYILEIEFGV